MYQALDTFSTLNLLMAEAEVREAIMHGKGDFKVHRILFRMPELDVIRKSQRESQKAKAAAYESKTAP